MGRGRAKAKQTKVARELKYYAPPTDLDALARELSGNAPEPAKPVAAEPVADDDELDWEEYAKRFEPADED